MSTTVQLPIRLTVPARPQHLRLARMTAASLATDLGFAMQDVEDARVAVDELAALLIEGADDGAELDLCFGSDGDALVVEGCVRDGRADVPVLHPVAEELLTLVASEFSVGPGPEGNPGFRLVKRAQGSGA